MRSDRVQRLLETIGVRALRLRECLEPVGDFGEAFLTGRLGHSRIHIRVLMGLTSDGGLEVQLGIADGQARGGIANGLQIFQVAVRMSGFPFRGGTEHRRHVVVAFNVRLLCEVQVTAIRLGFPGEGFLQTGLGLAALEVHDGLLAKVAIKVSDVGIRLGLIYITLFVRCRSVNGFDPLRAPCKRCDRPIWQSRIVWPEPPNPASPWTNRWRINPRMRPRSISSARSPSLRRWSLALNRVICRWMTLCGHLSAVLR